MRYTKPAVPVIDQLNLLNSRGLSIADWPSAEAHLSNISYYRLRAYTFPFQDNVHPKHPFKKPLNFEDIVALYEFDRQLRLLVFSALERIEISFRSQIIHQWALTHGSHWHINPDLYRDLDKFQLSQMRLEKELNLSKERFILHYRSKYTSPTEPACWMSLEVASFGWLSSLFANLKTCPEKRAVLKFYGLNKIELLENWMHSFSNLRNICAHHGRLWNRRLPTHVKLPKNTDFPFIKGNSLSPYKLYPVLCCIKYTLDRINSDNQFSTALRELISSCPLAQEHEMGFIKGWDQELLWQPVTGS